MNIQKENFNLANFVFDNNNQEKKACASLGQICSRSLIVFFSELFREFLDDL